MIIAQKMDDMVSVIIPTYNSSGTLRLAIKSILLQDYADFEVWIIGDGCTDDSESVVASFGDKRLKWVNLPENSGTPAMPRNEGLKQAQGRFIAYLGHDDLWFPWHLSRLIENIKNNNSDLVYSMGVFLGPDGVEGVLSLPEKSLNPHWAISPSNWLHHRELLDRVGGWPSSKVWAADMMVLRRLWRAGVRISFQKTLSVLKFTSTVWQNYSPKSEFPQLKYLEALSQDSEALRLYLLQEITALVSGQRVRWSGRRGFRELMRITMRFIFNIYGLHRWPVNQLMRRIWRLRSGLEENQNNRKGV